MNGNEDHLIKQKANILKALGNPTRLWIVETLKKNERCVCELVDQVEQDFSTISRHLNTLKNAGIISSEKKGKKVIYRLEVPCILDFISCVERVIINKFEKQKDLLN